MSSEVISKVTMSCEHSATILKMADKRLFAIVNSHVCLQVALFGEPLFTAFDCTSKWFQCVLLNRWAKIKYSTYMRSHMNLQTSSPWIHFSAVRARMGFITGVYQLMGLQMTFGDKSFATVFIRTSKRSFTSLGKKCKQILFFSHES